MLTFYLIIFSDQLVGMLGYYWSIFDQLEDVMNYYWSIIDQSESMMHYYWSVFYQLESMMHYYWSIFDQLEVTIGCYWFVFDQLDSMTGMYNFMLWSSAFQTTIGPLRNAGVNSDTSIFNSSVGWREHNEIWREWCRCVGDWEPRAWEWSSPWRYRHKRHSRPACAASYWRSFKHRHDLWWG